MNVLKNFLRLTKAAYIWTKLTFHNTWGIINVFNIVWIRPMKGGLINDEHPMATGINPKSNSCIWPENIIFRSKRPEGNDYPSDIEIVCAVGNHMKEMVCKSAASEAFPQGKPDRMPPAINYIHGAVHYNGGFLIFNDFKDAIAHFSNQEFRDSFVNFVKAEKREPVSIFRKKDYDRMEFLEFVCFLRTIFPWFSNCNGNKKRIGWGNPAPYPSVNTITGYWMDDTYKFYTQKGRSTLCRPPISKKYFLKESYTASRETILPEEKMLASFTNERVIARGKKGNVFFVDNRKLLKGYKFDPSQRLPNIIDRIGEKLQIS